MSTEDLATLKQAACDAIDKAAADLNDVSQEIWKNPELAYKEYHAHNTLVAFLQKLDFNVKKEYVLQTAFRSEHGTPNNPNIAVICEYDALPEIGHACGHNLIAEVGVGAAIGIKAAMDKAGKTMGKVNNNWQ